MTRLTALEALGQHDKHVAVWDGHFITKLEPWQKHRGNRSLYQFDSSSKSVLLTLYSQDVQIDWDVEVDVVGDVLTSVDPDRRLPKVHNLRFKQSRRPLWRGPFKEWIIQVQRRTMWMLDSSIVENTSFDTNANDAAEKGSLTRVRALPDLGIEESYAVAFSNSLGKKRNEPGYREPEVVPVTHEVVQLGPNVLTLDSQRFAVPVNRL